LPRTSCRRQAASEREDSEGELNGDIYLEVEEIQYNIDSESNTLPELSDEYKEVISKVRKVVRFFRRSPTKNDAVLQKYVLGWSEKIFFLISVSNSDQKLYMLPRK
jgi:hypothetical protein